MPEWKVISQRNWLKGLQATFGLFSQPSSILTRLSNLLYDRRGSLRTTDGSLVFTQRNGAVQVGDGPITDIVLYSPPAANAYYVGIQRSTTSQQGLPSALAGTPITVGGAIASATRNGGVVTLQTTAAHNLSALASLNGLPFNPGFLVVTGSGTDFDGQIAYNQIAIVNPTTITYPQAGTNGERITTGTLGTRLGAGSYKFTVTACDGSGGETPGQAAGPITVTVTAPNNAIQFTWTAGQYDSLYSLYETLGINAGRINPGVGAAQAIPGTSFAFLGATGGAGGSATPPLTNTTQTCAIYRMDAPSYTVQLGVVPPYIVPLIGGIPGTPGAAGGGGAGPTAMGGVAGGVSPLPQMVQFTGRLIFALGNGFQLQQYTDPSIDGTGFTSVGNTFTSQYPDWQPNVAWNQGDQIHDSVSNALFTATQGGVSGATRPAFHNTLNAITADNTVAWTCTAVNFQGAPLRGAAHACVYAGSLWLANTWPSTTSDQLDGPNCLKMSDVNNVSSWNPLNIAFIAKDDGDQLTGLATFTIAESGISPTGSLVVFKNFSTFQVTGVFGAADFSIQQAQTDLGCIAPRSIQFVPGYGITRLAHLGFAYFNGVSDKLISEEIRPYLFGGATDIQPVDWNYAYFAKAAQVANPPMYICAVPVLANTVSGVTLAARIPGTQVTMYARVSQLTNVEGAWVETNITPEVAVVGGDQSVVVTTPANTNPAINYRIYLGVAPGGENRYVQELSFTAFGALYAGMTPGTPSIGSGQLQRLVCYDLVQKAWAIVDLPFQISTLKQVRAPGTIPLTIAGGFSDGQVRRLFAGDTTWDTGDAVSWGFTTAEIFQQGASAKVFYRRLILRGQETQGASISVSIMLSGLLPPAVTAQQLNLGTNQWYFSVDIVRDALNANAQVSGTGPISIDSLDWHVKPKAAGAPVSAQK